MRTAHVYFVVPILKALIRPHLPLCACCGHPPKICGQIFIHAYNHRPPARGFCIYAQVLAPEPGCVEHMGCAVDNRQNL